MLLWLMQHQSQDEGGAGSSELRNPAVLAAAAACLTGANSTSTSGAAAAGATAAEGDAPGSSGLTCAAAAAEGGAAGSKFSPSAAAAAAQLLARWATSKAGAAQVAASPGLLVALLQCLQHEEVALVEAAMACIAALAGSGMQHALIEQLEVLPALVRCAEQHGCDAVAIDAVCALATLAHSPKPTGSLINPCSAVFGTPGAAGVLQACLAEEYPAACTMWALHAFSALSIDQVKHVQELTQRAGFLDALATCLARSGETDALFHAALGVLQSFCSCGNSVVAQHAGCLHALLARLTSQAAEACCLHGIVWVLRRVVACGGAAAAAAAAAVAEFPGALHALAACLRMTLARADNEPKGQCAQTGHVLRKRSFTIAERSVAGQAASVFKALARAPVAHASLLDQQDTLLGELTAALGHSKCSVADEVQFALHAWSKVPGHGVWDAITLRVECCASLLACEETNGESAHVAVRTLHRLATFKVGITRKAPSIGAAGVSVVPGLAAALRSTYVATVGDGGAQEATAALAAKVVETMLKSSTNRASVRAGQHVLLPALVAARGAPAAKPAVEAALQAWSVTLGKESIWDVLAQQTQELGRLRQLGSMVDAERNLQQAVVGLARSMVAAEGDGGGGGPQGTKRPRHA